MRFCAGVASAAGHKCLPFVCVRAAAAVRNVRMQILHAHSFVCCERACALLCAPFRPARTEVLWQDLDSRGQLSAPACASTQFNGIREPAAVRTAVAMILCIRAFRVVGRVLTALVCDTVARVGWSARDLRHTHNNNPMFSSSPPHAQSTTSTCSRPARLRRPALPPR